MKKVYLAIAAALVVALVTVGAVVGLRQEQGYPIADAGFTYSADGEVVHLGTDARYVVQSGRPLLVQGRTLTELDPSRLIRVEGGSLRVLNSAVAIESPSAVRDVVSKSLLTRDGIAGYTVTSPALGQSPEIPAGSLLKTAEDRYVLLDTATLVQGDGDAAQTLQTLGSETMIALDADGTVRLFDGTTTTSQIGDRLRVVLDTSGFVLDLSAETLTDPATDSTLDLSQVLVAFDDSPTTGLPHRTGGTEEPAEPSPSADAADATGTDAPGSSTSATAEGTGTGSADGTGTGTGTGTDGFDLPEVQDGRAQVPAVRLTAVAPRDVIDVQALVTDPAGSLRGLRAEVLAADGSTEAAADLTVVDGAAAWTSPAFAAGSVHTVRVLGSYADATGVVQQAVLGTVPVTVGELALTSTVTGADAGSVALDLRSSGVPADLDDLVLAYRENVAGSAALGTVAVPTGTLVSDGQVGVVVDGLSPQTSYVLTVASASAGGADLSSSWSTVVSTRSRTVTVTGTEAGYDAATQQLTVSLVGLDDPDGSVRQVRYLAFLADEYADQGLSAPVRASSVVGAERAAQPVSLALPAAMGEGEYVLVGVVTAHDGVDDYQVVAPASAALAISARHAPQALFALSAAGSDSLDVLYTVNDTDSTLVLDGSTHPVARLYRADAEGSPTGSPLSTVDLRTAEDVAGGTLPFDGLQRLTDYVVTMTASYDLGDGRVTDAVIGTSVVVSTTDVDPVVATFSLPTDRSVITTTQAQVLLRLTESASRLSTATLQVTDLSSGAVAQRTDLSGVLDGAIAPDRATLDLTALTPGTRYQLDVVDAADSGGNAVPVSTEGDTFSFQTRKRVPEADTVELTTVDVAAGTIAAQLRHGDDAVTDLDGAVTGISYQLLDATDPGTPVSEQTVTSVHGVASFDLLSIPGAGRGRTYAVRAVLRWNDGYEPGTQTFVSTEVDVPKAGPTADLTYLSRHGDDLTVRVTVTDPDATVLGTPVLTAGGQSVELAVGTQEVTIAAGTDATTVAVLADYRVLAGDEPVEGATLVSSRLLALAAPSGDPTVSTTWSGGREVAVTPSAADDLVDATLGTTLTVTADGAASADWTGTVSGAGAFAAQAFTVPQGPLLMGSTAQVTSTVTAVYQENGLSYDDLVGTGVVLTTADGSASVRSANGRLVLGTDRYATAYTVRSGTQSATGAVSDLVLTNAATGRYVGYSSYLNDTSTTSTAMNLVKSTDGTYLLQVNGRYVALTASGSTMVSSAASATPVVLYTTGERSGSADELLDLPTLVAPTVDVTEVSVQDTSVQVTVVGSDPDSTMVRDSAGAARLVVEVVLADDPSTTVASARVGALSGTVTLPGLVGGTEYLLRVVGTYDLGDGAGEHEVVYHESTVVTDKSLPSVTAGPTFVWNRLCSGTDPRQVRATISTLDPSGVLTGVEYAWYVKTSAFDGVDLTDTEALATAISAGGLTPVHTYDAGTGSSVAMPMFDGSTQHFYAGQTYVVVTSLRTSLDDAPQYLIGGRSLTITGPSAPTGVISAPEVTRTTATMSFTVSDPTYYLTCAEPMQFGYRLTDAAGTLVRSGSFTVPRSVTGPPDLEFTGLSANTTYTLTIASTAHDLKENGLRSWAVARTFATSTEYVTTNSVTFTVQGDIGRAAATNVQLGAADAITAARFELYRVTGYGEDDESVDLVETVPVDVPEVGATVSSGDLDLAAHGAGTYFVRLVLTYTVGGAEHEYTRDSVYRDVTPGTALLSATVVGGVAVLDTSALADGDLTVTATDAAGNVLSTSTVEAQDGRAVVFLRATDTDTTIQAVDEDGQVAAVSGLDTTGLLSGGLW